MPTVRDTPDAVLAAFAAKGMFPCDSAPPVREIAPKLVNCRPETKRAQIEDNAILEGIAEPLVITLPLSPSTNNLFRNAGKRRIVTPEYAAWKVRVAAILRKTPQWTGGYPVGITITIIGGSDWRMNADVANREKATVDALVSAGIIHSDSCKHVQDNRQRFERGPKELPTVMRVEIRSFATH